MSRSPQRDPRIHATVVGAGVIGLTTAVVLERAGYEVQVVAAERGVGTTSAVAAALWFPFRADPPERVNAWALRTRGELARLAASHPEAGVDLLTCLEAAGSPGRPAWAACTPDLSLDEGPHPLGAPCCLRFGAPRVEPALHLPWLESLLRRPVRIEQVSSLDDVDGDWVVNCTGLGARALTGDPDLQGIYGQVVATEPGELSLEVALGDERDPEALLYAIPRRREVVLGGCAVASPDDRPLTPEPGLTEAILRRARAAGLRPGRTLRAAAGLRPYRKTVRLEREGRVVHNYGHGGAGYTLAWACAEDVKALIEAG